MSGMRAGSFGRQPKFFWVAKLETGLSVVTKGREPAEMGSCVLGGRLGVARLGVDWGSRLYITLHETSYPAQQGKAEWR